ncbi:hypothetical protein L1987_42531 [Smallanthus sonchifolius]|uniref:Uncharacterized protein n=1 Tax=Smallanthus sonchifolius TaxID=185202 RepID=A0ACB9GIV1_9ASTR|nr:hypothetical protein L1987_42531 [Smallanthus sonchifolius]
MDITVTGDATVQTTKLSRRLVLLPYPLEDHINPMLQLASILHSKGFSISILHTRFNAPNPSDHPHFNFVSIPDVAGEKLPVSGTDKLIRLMHYLNDNCLDQIRDCLERLLSEDAGTRVRKRVRVARTTTIWGFLVRVVEGRGYIVKWAPQQEVLAHRSTAGFWTHNGWNSTLESICEGVPMICSPSFGDQLPNARNVIDVWKIGVELENGFERGEIESVIKRLMVDEEGLEMRDRVMSLREKVNICLKKGGSSHSSLEDLVNYIMSC